MNELVAAAAGAAGCFGFQIIAAAVVLWWIFNGPGPLGPGRD